MIVTSLAFSGTEAMKLSGSVAFSVSSGDASFIIGVRYNSVAWTEVQIEPWQGWCDKRIGDRDWSLCVIL